MLLPEPFTPPLARRREIRGKGVCALCLRPVYGELDYPSAADCHGFFGGALEAGDGVCFWCIEDWAYEPDEQTRHGRA